MSEMRPFSELKTPFLQSSFSGLDSMAPMITLKTSDLFAIKEIACEKLSIITSLFSSSELMPNIDKDCAKDEADSIGFRPAVFLCDSNKGIKGLLLTIFSKIARDG